jgi:hypothetical protein
MRLKLYISFKIITETDPTRTCRNRYAETWHILYVNYNISKEIQPPLSYFETESNSVITLLKGLNILCRYKQVSLQPRSVMLWLTVTN